MWLLDTCVVSELLRRRPDPFVVTWIDQQPQSLMHFSCLTVGELEKGAASISDVAAQARIRSAASNILAKFYGRILPVDEQVALLWGRVSGRLRGRGIACPDIDGLLAATALANDLTLVTRNIRDFAHTGARVFNPWNGPTG